MSKKEMSKEEMVNIRDFLAISILKLTNQIKEQAQNIEKNFGRNPSTMTPKEFISSSKEAHMAYDFGCLNGMSYITFVLDTLYEYLKKEIKEKEQNSKARKFEFNEEAMK